MKAQAKWIDQIQDHFQEGRRFVETLDRQRALELLEQLKSQGIQHADKLQVEAKQRAGELSKIARRRQRRLIVEQGRFRQRIEENFEEVYSQIQEMIETERAKWSGRGRRGGA